MTKNRLSLFLLLCVLAASMFPVALADTTIPSTTYMTMPTYSTQFNFASEQTFTDIYRELSSNTSYPEFWFFTLQTGELYGLQSIDTNFTVTTVFSSQTLTYFPNTGTVNVYCGSLGTPITVTGAISWSYNDTNKVASITALGSNYITVSWATPAPTPTPTPAPPSAVTLTIQEPTATTYTTNDILVSLAATGGTIDKVWFNVKNGSSWVYSSAIIYSGPYFMTGFANGSYTLYAYANNTLGYSDSGTVDFTVSASSAPFQPGLPTVTIGKPQNITYIVNSIPVSITSTDANAVWFNVKNGSNWIYSYNHTYASATTLTGFDNGTYTFYAFAANSIGGTAYDTQVFTVYALPNVTLPQVDMDNFWIFLYEGNFLGFLQAMFITNFFTLETAIALIVFLFMVPIYLRTKSLLLLCVLWLLIGSFIIAAVPIASGIAVLFMVLAVGGLVYRLFRGSSTN